MEPISILNGAFTSELVKGKDGRTNWVHKANLSKIGVREESDEEKEQPEFEVSRDIEQAAVNHNRKQLEQLSLTFVKFMKSATR